MNNWTRFNKALRVLSPNTADGVEALYGPPGAVSGQSDSEAEWASDSPEDREGYMESLSNDYPPDEIAGQGWEIDDYFRPWPSYGVAGL